MGMTKHTSLDLQCCFKDLAQRVGLIFTLRQWLLHSACAGDGLRSR